MAPTLDVSHLFNQDDYCDVTIKFSGREIKSHRMVLCEQLDYFKKLCGPRSKFAESAQSVIELYDDDPDALEALLRWLYSRDNNEGISGRGMRKDYGLCGWRAYLDFSVVARKYGAEAEASDSLDRMILLVVEAAAVSGPRTIVDICQTLQDYAEHDEALTDAIAHIAKEHREILLQTEEFRTFALGNPDIIWKLLAVPSTAHLSRKEIHHCSRPRCGTIVRCDPGEAPRCHWHGDNSMALFETCWTTPNEEKPKEPWEALLLQCPGPKHIR